MKKKLFILFIISFSIFIASCKVTYRATVLQFKNYKINDTIQVSKTIQSLVKPYKDSMQKNMGVVIGHADKLLDKKLPESSLGNFMADVCFKMAEKKYKTNIDVAFVNYGGIRLSEIPKGNITKGQIYELMPFDNLLIIQKLKGNVLQKFLDLTASQGGVPMSGMTMRIVDSQTGKKAIDVLIGGKPIDPDAIYNVVNPDYVANGGDDAIMLKNIPQISAGYLVRDALFDYIKELSAAGKHITAQVENRVTYAQ